MENREGIDVSGDPALAGADGALESRAVSADPAVEASGHRAASVKRPASAKPSDEERLEMHASFNNRISYLCKLVALIIAVVAFATIALGREVPQYVFMGLCMAIALLAIAMLQDHHQRRR